MKWAELLHKALGHVSFKGVRQHVGIPMNNCQPCDASCALSKFKEGSFHTRHSKSSKNFEELNQAFVGPISPASQEGHCYFLTVVDSCTPFCSAIPLKSKSVNQSIDLEARCMRYCLSIIHFDRRTKFINKCLSDFCNENQIKTYYSNTCHNKMAYLKD